MQAQDMAGNSSIIWWKRPFDLIVTVPATIALAPVIAVLTLLVRVKLGAPVFFRQERPERHGHPLHHDQIPHHDRRPGCQW